MKAITVTQLNKYIKNIIENDIHLCNICVKGEISNFKRHSSGHCYMTIKDETSAIRAVMFRGSADKLKFEPENGMNIISEGRVSVYERDGQYQLYITSMSPDGVGDLYVAYEQLKAKLEKEGVFSAEHKKPIPKYPAKVGVATSPTGAAVRDIINVITRRCPSVEIILYPVLVQGDGAAEDVARAINYFNEEKEVDVIIVGRGGGSIEDLWAFNEEVVARAIYASEIPIISAVGHETDFTIADFAADFRAPTPSAAAEVAVPSKVEIIASLRQNYSRMLYSLRKEIENRRNILKRFSLKSPMDAVLQNRIYLDRTEKQLNNATVAYIEKLKKHFAVSATKLDGLSPLKILNRGYSITENETGVINSVSQVDENSKITVRLSDGKVKCTANEIVAVK